MSTDTSVKTSAAPEPAVPPAPKPGPVTHCPECGAPLVNILTGATCPRGCGGLFPLLSQEANTQARRELRVSELAACRCHATLKFIYRCDFADCGLYLLTDGPEGVFYRRVARAFVTLKAAEGNTLARTEGGSVVELTTVKI